MDFVNVPLFIAAAVVFASVLAGLFSARIGLSSLLAADPSSSIGSELFSGFVRQFGWRAALGLASGFAMAWLVAKLPPQEGSGGILALLLGAGGIAVFTATGVLGGSGFLAVYLFGLIVANRAAASTEPALKNARNILAL